MNIMTLKATSELYTVSVIVYYQKYKHGGRANFYGGSDISSTLYARRGQKLCAVKILKNMQLWLRFLFCKTEINDATAKRGTSTDFI
jgi:hypothetical protein